MAQGSAGSHRHQAISGRLASSSGGAYQRCLSLDRLFTARGPRRLPSPQSILTGDNWRESAKPYQSLASWTRRCAAAG